jgi:acylphosphatase
MSSVQWLSAIWKINQNLYKTEKHSFFMKCIHLIVLGRVQGVFFRDNVRRKANELGLHGYTKNLEDGTVEVVAQGNEEKINQLIEFIKQGPGIAKVANIIAKHKNPGNFSNFEIRH